jgi:hypothetical protein
MKEEEGMRVESDSTFLKRGGGDRERERGGRRENSYHFFPS